MQLIFWFSVAAIFYAYIGYPVILYVLSMFHRKTIRRDEQYCPPISLIITVHNEQERVQQKIENTLALDYPREKMEIIFASDASTDNTEEIVQSNKQLKLIRAPERRGKEFAQKCAVDHAGGEILVFSDVATMLAPEGARMIVANFADPTVGCVSSEDRVIDEHGKISGEGAYVKYEMLLRRLESRIYSLVGLSGSFFAARREVCTDWAVNLQSDFNTLLNSLKLGLRGISDPNSLGYYRNIADGKKEFNRKVRTVLRGLSVLGNNIVVLNPFRYGMFSWELFSHKLCRWLVPYFLVFAFISNLFLLKVSHFYSFLFGLQIVFYCMAIFCFVLEEIPFPAIDTTIKQRNFYTRLINSLRIPYYFIVVNAAIFMAWVKFFKGDQSVFWEPSKR